MNPRVIDDMSWAMAEVYGAVTDKLLVNLARHFKYTKTDNGGTFAYMAQKLAELGQVRKESVDIIMQNLTGADEMLRVVLENAIGYALKDVEPELKAASVKGMLNPSGMVPELTPNQTRAFKAYYAQSADKLNLVNTVMLESTEAAYQATVSDIVNRVSRSQSLLNIATGEVVSGASSWNSAVRDAVKGMVENGLTGFIDHGGHRWRPETYVAMDVRTTAFNAAREAVMERNESYGNDLYQVSSHNGARPLCYPWQGKIISSADASREVEDLDGNKVHVYAQSETSYGQAAGLFGVNCGHYPIPFIPGFSRLRGSGQSEEDNAKAYAESQEQRKLERKVRKEKLDLDVMKAQGAGAEEIAAQKQRVRNAQADVSAFCEQTGMARHRDREFLPVDAKRPEKGSYDPAAFPTGQKDKILNYVRGGGLQSYETNGIIITRQMFRERASVKNSSLENGLPIKGRPNSIVDKTDDAGKVLQRRIYGNNGMAAVDYDTTDHGLPAQHKTGAHRHVFNYGRKQPHGKPLPLTEEELIANEDIIQRGVNYFDS